MRTHAGEKNVLLPGVWKKIFRCQLPDHAHANTHWGKTSFLPEMWKKIYPITSPVHAHANTYWRKTLMLPGVRKKVFGCWLLSFLCANTHCIENHFVASGVERSFNVHVT